MFVCQTLCSRRGTELFFSPQIETSICAEKPHLSRYTEINKRRQGHLRFATEPKQSTKGRRQLPGNTIPITAGSGVEQNINHFQLHLTGVTVLQCSGQTEVSHYVQSHRFIPVFAGILLKAWWERDVSRYIYIINGIHFWELISY